MTSTCKVVDGVGTCERAFDANRCQPGVVTDSFVLKLDEEAVELSLADNDRLYGHEEEFVWVAAGNARAGLGVDSRGRVKLVRRDGPRIRRFQYQVCLKNGMGCFGPAQVTVYLIGEAAAAAEEEKEPATEARGMMQQRQPPVPSTTGPALPTALECGSNETFAVMCASDFDEGCPYGYDNDWQCLPPPPSEECIEAAWKKRLAELWVDFFGPSADVNVDFEGLLRQSPCESCQAASRAAQ